MGSSTVVGTNMCAPRPLVLKGNGIRGGGRVANKDAYTVHTMNIIFQPQYVVSRCLSSYVGDVFDLHSICVCSSSTRKIVT
jgi:hypothetical protein